MKTLLTFIVACLCVGLLLSLGLTQELPVGGIKGTVTMRENGKPLGRVLVVVSPASHDDSFEFNVHNYHVRTDANGQFALAHIPSGDYRLEVAAKEHHLKAKIVTVSEGGTTPVELDLSPEEPNLQIYASTKVIAPRSSARIEIRGFTEQSDVEVEVRKLRLEDIASKDGVREALEPVAYNHNESAQEHIDGISERISLSTHAIEKRDAEGAFIDPINVAPLDEGLYLVTVGGGDLRASVYLNVSRLALVTKTAGRNALCFVTDIDSGQPLPNVPLSTTVGANKMLKIVAHTDRNGLATIHAGSNQNAKIVIAELGASVAVSNAPMNTWTQEGGSGVNNSNTRIFTYSDRPVYRPGDTVQFKSVIRKLTGNDLVLPGSGTAEVRVSDDQENLLQVLSVPVSVHGTISGHFSTSSEARPGFIKSRYTRLEAKIRSMLISRHTESRIIASE